MQQQQVQVIHHTVKEVRQSLQDWEKLHNPTDRSSRLNLFQFVMEAGTGGALVPLETSLQSTAEQPPIILMPHAQQQMFKRLDYDSKLYPRLPPKLNVWNLNWLIQHSDYDKALMMRLQDGNKMRAMVTQSYQPMDDLEVVSLIEPFSDDALVRWEFNDEMSFHLSITFPKTGSTEIRVGDVVEQGIHISNSEVGVRSVTVAGFVYRLRCKNGAVGGGDGDVFRIRHMGDRDRLRETVAAAIKSCQMEAEKITAQFKIALNTSIPDPATMVEAVSKKEGLTREQYKASLDALMGEPEAKTLFGVSQSFSQAAHKFTGDQSWEMQKLSAKVLTMG